MELLTFISSLTIVGAVVLIWVRRKAAERRSADVQSVLDVAQSLQEILTTLHDRIDARIEPKVEEVNETRASGVRAFGRLTVDHVKSHSRLPLYERVPVRIQSNQLGRAGDIRYLKLFGFDEGYLKLIGLSETFEQPLELPWMSPLEGVAPLKAKLH